MADAPIRRETRAPFKARVKVKCETWEKVVSLWTQNISRGGIFLRIENAPAVGTDIVVSLGLPDGRTLELPATVAHVVSPERAKEEKRAPGVGLFFKELSPDKRAILEQLFARS